LQSGPMVGFADMREVQLWVQTKEPASVKIKYWEEGKPEEVFYTEAVRTTAGKAFSTHLVADQVQPGRRYTYVLYINNKQVKRPYALGFQTQELWQWRKDAPDFRFAIGSCAYVNDVPYDRPGRPYGGDYGIFTAIHARKPDFMLWLGDNTYLREPDWNTRTGVLYRYTHTRSLPELQPLLGSTSHYAIWDDHDYGPDNADRSFWGKDLTLEAFKMFWANPNYVLLEEGGITGTFTWQDVQFFLLDDRWFKAPNEWAGERTLLGDRQLQWLLDALSSSQATFKVIAIGGQVLNPSALFENYSTYEEERQRLLQQIQQADIRGVLFLTGDRHHTVLTKLERPGTYPLYDLTVSPLTAGVAKPKDGENPLQVPGTLVTEKNFAVVEVTGPQTDRRLKMRIFDNSGKELWQRELKATELQ